MTDAAWQTPATLCGYPARVNSVSQQRPGSGRRFASHDRHFRCVLERLFRGEPRHRCDAATVGARYDALPDTSIAGVRARGARRELWRAELREIDRVRLDAPAALAYDVTAERLEALHDLELCQYELWPVGQLFG